MSQHSIHKHKGAIGGYPQDIAVFSRLGRDATRIVGIILWTYARWIERVDQGATAGA